MKVSTNSWHYKYLTTANIKFESVPTNLCPYVRHILLQIVAQMLVCGILVGTALGPLWIFLYGWDFTNMWWLFLIFTVLFYSACVICTCGGLVIAWYTWVWKGGINLQGRLWTRRRENDLKRYNRAQDGEVTAWERIKTWCEAIHGKICPIVEWE